MAEAEHKLQILELQEQTCEKLIMARAEITDDEDGEGVNPWKSSSEEVEVAEKQIEDLIELSQKKTEAETRADSPAHPDISHLTPAIGAMTEFLWRLNFLSSGGIIDVETPNGMTMETAVENALKNLQKELSIKE